MEEKHDQYSERVPQPAGAKGRDEKRLAIAALKRCATRNKKLSFSATV
jgi:hypothetical protein